MKKEQGYKPEKHEDKKLQDKLKKKEWDPFEEMGEIMDEYEEGVPKRKSKYDYGGGE